MNKQLAKMIMLAALPSLLLTVWLEVSKRHTGPKEIQKEALEHQKEVFTGGLDFLKEVNAIALAAFGGVGALIYFVSEKRRFSGLQKSLVALCMGCLGAAVLAGYQTQIGVLRMFADTAAVALDKGFIDTASTWQAGLLLVGAFIYGVLILILVHENNPSK